MSYIYFFLNISYYAVFVLWFWWEIIVWSNWMLLSIKESFDQLFSQCSISTVFVFFYQFNYLFINFSIIIFISTVFWFLLKIRVDDAVFFSLWGEVSLGEICAIFLIIELTKIMNWFFLFINSWESYSQYKYANAFPTHTLKLKSS